MAETETNTLAGVSLLDPLGDPEREALERACSWRHYDPHEQILDRQSESQDVCFVVKGRVRVVNYSLTGREITLDDVMEGSYFGELAAIDGAPRSASVMALDKTLIAFLPRTAFVTLLEKHADVTLTLLRRLAMIIRTSTDRIMDLSTLGANNRVHAELLRQARLVMDDESTEAVLSPIPVHGDIASRVSTTRETVARVMNDLARQGIVERRKEALAITDPERLEDLVEQVRGD
ncbi:Crp/Fnr family transcriptional regulator [Magnetospira sp. QH-2]|uniref:Crp/Fnr family transcriptional regulator n=1 Tax=Magnetospira sp. (strain QH-2) TaxID=1288970 RepID=UPI0003E8101B|nr:Crp/Fnr family transcriptional regulator [Magnetospira sp. QH-2]CCQ75165.1 putative transcriptional regulator, Crp family [Magnetospira sp. QH-2]